MSLPSRVFLLTTIAALVTACSTDPPATDGGRDAPGRDAPRATDAGFDPASLAPCEVDLSLASDLTGLAAYARLPAEPMADRLFYPFVVLASDGSTADLSTVTAARRVGLTAASACAGAAACVRSALAWSAAESAGAADAALAALTTAGTSARVAAELRGSGVCARWDGTTDDALVRACLSDALVAATAALDGPVLGELDATALDAAVDAAAALPPLPFWGPIVEVVSRGLVADGRDEAIRYEPLAVAENAAAEALLAATDFDAFPFAAIIVPGQGPDDDVTALHPSGRARADLGYERWAAGLAPVVLVSGGHVHPDRTRFSEAIEMRRYLVETRGMPASAVLVDPYARHTTTNLRNATRILVRAGVPGDRPLLVTSDILQSAYVRSTTFDVRCDDELGYRPYADLTMLSPLDACFLSVPTSMHVDARDPLDP